MVSALGIVRGLQLQEVTLCQHHFYLEVAVVIHVSPLPNPRGVRDTHDCREEFRLHGVEDLRDSIMDNLLYTSICKKKPRSSSGSRTRHTASR